MIWIVLAVLFVLVMFGAGVFAGWRWNGGRS